MMGIPFHTDILGNVVYLSSKTSVVARENTLCPFGSIGVVGQSYDFFFAGHSVDSGMRLRRWVGGSPVPGVE